MFRLVGVIINARTVIRSVSAKHKTNSIALHQRIVGIAVWRHVFLDPAWQRNRKGLLIFSLLCYEYNEIYPVFYVDVES